jgi:hypothetical protein
MTPYHKSQYIPYYIVSGSGFSSSGAVNVTIVESYETVPLFKAANAIVAPNISVQLLLKEYFVLLKTIQSPMILTTFEEYTELEANLTLKDRIEDEKDDYAWIKFQFFPMNYPPSRIPDSKLLPTGIINYEETITLPANTLGFIDPFASIQPNTVTHLPTPDNAIIVLCDLNIAAITSLLNAASGTVKTGMTMLNPGVEVYKSPIIYTEQSKMRLLAFIAKFTYTGNTLDHSGYITVGVLPRRNLLSIEPITITMINEPTHSRTFLIKEVSEFYYIYKTTDTRQLDFSPSNRVCDKPYLHFLSSGCTSCYSVEVSAFIENIPNPAFSDRYNLSKEPIGMSASEQLEHLQEILGTSSSILTKAEYNKLVSKLS